MSTPEKNRVDRYLSALKNHRVLSIFIVSAVVVIGAAQLTGALGSLLNLFSNQDALEAERIEYCELLAPMIVQLDRTRVAFERWNSQNLPLETKIILDGNEAVKALLLLKAHLVPSELKEDAAKLVEHYDRWLEEYERLRGGPNPNLDEPFVFVGPKGYPFPRGSAQKFRARYEELGFKLGESPCR